jgi:cell division protein ZapA (FtsZ GTPase activity inhibitor)
MHGDQDLEPMQPDLEAQRTSVTVPIGGEVYNLRVITTPDYALRCAAVVDAAMKEIVSRAALVDPHRAAILSALSVADRMFRAARANGLVTLMLDSPANVERGYARVRFVLAARSGVDLQRFAAPPARTVDVTDAVVLRDQQASLLSLLR